MNKKKVNKHTNKQISTRRGSLQDAGILLKLLPSLTYRKDHFLAYKMTAVWMNMKRKRNTRWLSKFKWIWIILLFVSWIFDLPISSRTQVLTFIACSIPIRLHIWFHLFSDWFSSENFRHSFTVQKTKLGILLWNMLYIHCNVLTVFIIHDFIQK